MPPYSRAQEVTHQERCVLIPQREEKSSPRSVRCDLHGLREHAAIRGLQELARGAVDDNRVNGAGDVNPSAHVVDRDGGGIETQIEKKYAPGFLGTV